MAQIRRAKNYLMWVLAIATTAVVSWFGLQPPTWANTALHRTRPQALRTAEASAPANKRVRKTARAPLKRAVARRSSSKTASARAKAAA